MNTIKTVIKRSGQMVNFNHYKIYNALVNAAISTYPDCSVKDFSEDLKDLTNKITNAIAETYGEKVFVEDIQDTIEQHLMDYDKFIAKNYVTYRYRHALARDRYSLLMNDVKKKLMALDVQNQNANVDEKSFGGRKGETNDLLMKRIALEDYISETAAENHKNNMVYIHDLGDYVVGSHNCFDPSTKFITSNGVKSFNDFKDGDIITVLTPSGTWNKATVNYHGKQQLLSYTFKKNKTEVTIKATKDHRWINIDGDFQEGLSINDKLLDSPWFWQEFNFDDLTLLGKEYWCYGFVMGDGTLETRYSKKDKKYHKTGTTKVKLCKDKLKYLYRFQEIGYGLKCYSQEPEVTGINYDKTIPDFSNLPIECLISFIHGLYDADGTHCFSASTGKPIYNIQFTNKNLCDFVEKYFPVAGLYINSIKDKTGQKTNFAVRGYTKNYQFFGEHSNKFNWYVKNITQEDTELHDVWCLNVENEHAFVLENGIPTGNCLTIPFDMLFEKGFNTRQTDVRPPQSISTAFQLLAVIFQLQSLQQFGGCSSSHLDWTMVPYVRKSFTKHLGDGLAYIEKLSEYKVNRFHKWIEKDKENHPDGTIHFDDEEFKTLHPDAWEYAMDMTVRETEQAAESMFHNLNTLQSRSGNQLPFTSVNLGTCTLPEGRLVTQKIFEAALNGTGKFHRTSIFPCLIFQCMKGINRKPGDPNYDLFKLAIKCTAKRLYPNYCNVDWSINTGYDKNDPKTYVSTMGCRTYNGADINADEGVNPQTKDGRGNICPVTIILPTLAMEAKLNSETEEERISLFFAILERKIREAKDALIERFNWICSQSPDSAKFMYENNIMLGYKPEEGIRSALKHGTLAMGQIGLAETLQLLIDTDHTTKKGMKLAKKIEQLFKDRCAKYKQDYHLNFGVYMTPAENLCYTSMKKFQEKYGIIPKVSDKEFFTNSIHVPVWTKINPFEKIDIEAELCNYSNAGCITYVELESSVMNNLDALEALINYAMDKDIPYFAINIPNDTCNNCGYTSEINDKCPLCNCEDISRLRRVTGYLTGNYKTAFNKGKQQEVEMRYKHSKKLENWKR